MHWLVGTTLGTILAFSGLTGGLMAFGPEITDFFAGAYQKLEVQPQGALGVAALHAKIRDAYPEKTLTQLMLYEDPQKPARVQFAAPPGQRGPTGPRPESRLVNPYTGELLPDRPMAHRVEWFMLFLRDIHQGHWAGPGTISSIAATLVGLGSVFLFFMALSGLYLHWPRGIAARRWSTWFKINPKLKGRAFLWNLHTVLGTCVLLVYLVIAHSGAFQNGEMSWYGNAVRSLFGLPLLAERGPPGAEGPPPAAGGPGMGGPGMAGGPGMGGPPPGAGASGAPRGVTIIYMNAESYVNADTEAINAKTARLDTTTGIVTPQAEGATPNSFGEKLAANNQIIHEGRIFGKGGVLIVMLAALCMPVFYVSGWMMYLDRRRRKQAAKIKAHQVSPKLDAAAVD